VQFVAQNTVWGSGGGKRAEGVGGVNISGPNRITIGSKKLFQLPMNTKTACAASTGFAKGKTICQKIPKVFKPFSCAASSSSLGKLTKNCRIMKIKVALTMLGVN
jgi:hypothetical protein